MKTQTLSFTTLFGFLGFLLLIHTFNASAASSGIECQTGFGEKTFIIEDGRIAFLKEDHSGINRSLSSVAGDSVRTHKKHLGFTKTLYVDGLRHKITIKNKNEFSEVNDYLSITSPKGHEMTYPLTCRSV